MVAVRLTEEVQRKREKVYFVGFLVFDFDTQVFRGGSLFYFTKY